MYIVGQEFEKPVDLVLNHIEGMKNSMKYLDIEIEHLQNKLIGYLNQKISLEEKLSKWITVADRFKFKKKS